MPRLKLIEMDSFNKMIYFRKDDKIVAFDADVAIELISDSLDGKNEPVRQGHWIEIHDLLYDYIRCSECGEDWCTEDNDTETFNYCPNCGAMMDEVINE